ncbi:MAG: flagellar hook-basal body complex protein FliE [Planctomycetes bacterium]|nr:flagellar hook-basal body complex protein FliE [Planctomycetota bacterium]
MSQINTSTNLGGVGGPGGMAAPAARTTGAPPQRFSQVLKESIAEVNRMQADADQAINALATGRTDNVAEVMTAVQKADLAFKTLLQIRNKLLDAYNEVRQMRM